MIKEAIIIDGKKIAYKILADLKAKIDKDRSDGVSPAKLAIILVGNDSASTIYVQNKIKAAAKVGIETKLQSFNDNITENELLKRINNLNQDEEVSG
ncbi:MAG: tetrahydrofolate dehydrogenase/cyclohydrolase catalytic domain-containing protein, partial [Pseudomonadota bacterium]